MCSRKPLPRVVWAFVIRSDASKTSHVIKFVHNFACANAQFKYCLRYFRSGVSKSYFECTQEVRYGVLDRSIDLPRPYVNAHIPNLVTHRSRAIRMSLARNSVLIAMHANGFSRRVCPVAFRGCRSQLYHPCLALTDCSHLKKSEIHRVR